MAVDQELQVVETRVEFAERLSLIVGMADEAEHQRARGSTSAMYRIRASSEMWS